MLDTNKHRFCIADVKPTWVSDYIGIVIYLDARKVHPQPSQCPILVHPPTCVQPFHSSQYMEWCPTQHLSLLMLLLAMYENQLPLSFFSPLAANGLAMYYGLFASNLVSGC